MTLFLLIYAEITLYTKLYSDFVSCSRKRKKCFTTEKMYMICCKDNL